MNKKLLATATSSCLYSRYTFGAGLDFNVDYTHKDFRNYTEKSSLKGCHIDYPVDFVPQDD